MQPNKVGKPFSWYNNEHEADQILISADRPPSKLAYNDDSSCPWMATESENVEEPDMKGTEEGVLSYKIDEMNPVRGRVRTSSQFFPKKDTMSAPLNNTEDLRKVIAQVKAFEFHSLISKEKVSTRNDAIIDDQNATIAILDGNTLH